MDNLAVRIASDPTLIKLYSRLKDPFFNIPADYEDHIKKFGNMKSIEKGALISKATSPEDYQVQLYLLSKVNHLMDTIHDIVTNLYSIHMRWVEMFKVANKHIILTYFDEVNALKENVRKTVVAIALQPVQDGLDKLEYLIKIAESSYKHLSSAAWDVKEGSNLLKEYLTTLKYAANIGVKEL